MEVLYSTLTEIMNICYELCSNYGWAIILFTLLSKVLLLPLSVWVQKNSIKMIKMQPDVNQIHIKYYGDKDSIAEETAKLYKDEKYHPMASIVPTIIQLLLLMGVIEAVKRGMHNPSMDMHFWSIDLSTIPSQTRGMLLLSPIMAGISALLMCIAQNKSNVLQSEQSKANQYGMLIFSVGLSLYLGWFVPVGVVVYWVASNLMAIAQLYFLNLVISPKKYVDYERLEQSKSELEALQGISHQRHTFLKSANEKREKMDYKRFFHVVNKHLVFYSESNGFYKYYKGIIEYLLEHTNITIHYITSDPNDNVFEICKEYPKLKAYYISEKKLITLMMKMEADIVVMTMPDLENYHIKRSYIQKDIEYVYIPHGMDSLNMTMRTGSLDHFDTVFCAGPHQKEEIEKTEQVYGLHSKTLVESGYCLLDEMRKAYRLDEEKKNEVKKILIAPSWQKDNIVDSCLDEVLACLSGKGYRIVVRPHPQQVRHQPDRMESLKAKWETDEIEIQTDFSSNSTVFEADIMITDWSGIAYEYAFTTCKPVLFIDTPMKVMNPEYQRIDIEPINIWMRSEIGRIVLLGDISTIDAQVEQMISESDLYKEKIDVFVHDYIYNLGNSAQVGAEYLIQSIQKKIQNRKENGK